MAGSVAGEDGGEGGGAGSLVLWGDRGVRRVVFDGRRATGIELDDGSVASAGLVVVCCGALHTPWLVRRSGIVAPAVGRSIEDHPSFTFTVELDPDARQPSDVPVEPISAVLRWHSIPGLAADAIPDTIPDTMALIMDHVGLGTTGRRFGAVIVALTDVASRGRVGEAPAFRPGWLDAADDGRRLVAAVRHVAGLLADGCFDPVVAGVHLDDRGTPLDALEAMSDSDVEGWLRRHPGPVSHIAGGCPPGGPDPVVEAGGALIGYDGLSIIDASVLPRLPSGNPQVAVMAVAERLSAELLK